MRRSLPIIAAAAIALGVSAASFSSAGAATPMPAPKADVSPGAIIEVDRYREGGRHRYREGRHSRRHFRHHRNRHYGHHRHRHHNDYSYPFFFGFPFAFRPQFYPYPSYSDCFRTWDGQLICRGY